MVWSVFPEPWTPVVKQEDGYHYVAVTFALCLLFQFTARHVALLIIGRNSPKRGLAARIGVKLVSVMFGMVAVQGGLKQLIAPEEAVLVDPIYGFSSHSQFHFSVAAGYFAWAGVVTILYRGSKVSLAHHAACCLVYMLTLQPFLHHIGNLFLLFQASTLLIDLSSCCKVLGMPLAISDRLHSAHSVVFCIVRWGVGLPMSAYWIRDMIELLRSGEAHSVAVVGYMIAVNALINVLNLYWGVGMILGMPWKPACSAGSKPVQYFDVGISISFGVREKPHQPAKRRKANKAKMLEYLDQTVSVNVFLASVVIAVLGIGAGVDQFAFERLGYNGSDPQTQTGFGLVVLAFAYTAFHLLEKYGPQIFNEAHSSKNPLFTRIRGEWYDLKDFDHPGGPVALALAEGRDATALFESHHYLIETKRLYAVLNKYKVEPKVASTLKTLDPRDDGAHFDWESFHDDAFTNDVKSMVVDHFRPEAERRGISLRQATKATPERWFMIIGLMASFFATLPYYVVGHWWTLFATPFLAWVVICNYWHDGLHFSLSCDWRVNAILPYLFPWLSSPWMWYHQHVIGHHCYTNVAHKDPDLAHAPQLMREHNSIKWRKAHANQKSWSRVLLVWSVAVGLGLQVLSDVRANLKGTYNNVVPYKSMETARFYAHSAGRIIYVASLFVWPFACFPAWKALIWAFAPITLFSWYFMINSQINHLTEDTAHAEDKNFLKHQIITAQDFGTQSWWCYFFSGGLNMQIEHHMFPCVNHCHLPALQKKVKDICKKHGVKYNEVDGYVTAFNRHIAHTKKMGVRPFSVGHEY